MAIKITNKNGETFTVAGAGKNGKDGVGVPAGGTAGQFLKKKSNTDHDSEWGNVLANDIAGIGGMPSGGLAGQMLVKSGTNDYAADWGGYHSNPNLLLNWDFRKPVNRNGKSEYATAGYTIDRWRIDGGDGSVKVVNGSLELSAQTKTLFFGQTLKIGLVGQIVTLSCLFLQNEFVAITGVIAEDAPQPLYRTTAFGAIKVERNLSNNVIRVLINTNANMISKPIAIKLELGYQQTLAHQDADGNWVLNDPPNYDLQYALCSQYSPITGEFVGISPISNYSDSHRNFYRGKYLGNHVTDEQKAAIQNGTFDDLFVGDYWTIGGVNWRIADMDYWYNCGDAAFIRHHLVIVPDAVLYNAQMNTSNVTTGAYIGSAMYTANLAQAKTTITAAFGDMLLTHRNIFGNAVTNGKTTGYAWVDSKVDLMNEIMVYGTTVFLPGCDGTTVPTIYTIDNSQLALFALNPRFIKTRQNYWLRDVVSAAFFALMSSTGNPNFYGASSFLGVRPAFAIG